MFSSSLLRRVSLCQSVFVTVLFSCCSLPVSLASASPQPCSPDTRLSPSPSCSTAFSHAAGLILSRSDHHIPLISAIHPEIQTLKPPSVAKHSPISKTTRHSRAAIMMCADSDSSSALGDAAAKLSVLSIPLEPSADLSAEDVVRAVCAGLQHNNLPDPNTGLARLYAFSDLKCRSAITARQGAKSLERFVQYSELSLLAPLINSDAWGDLATQVVLVTNKINFRYRSGLERPEGSEEEETTPFRFMLERQRRPPLSGCWLVTELLCLRDEFIFNGDTGAVQG